MARTEQCEISPKCTSSAATVQQTVCFGYRLLSGYADPKTAEIRELEKGLKGAELLKIVQRAVEAHFGRAAVGKRYVGVVVLDARGDLQIEGITHHSALSDGIGMVGSRSLYTLPSCIEEVVSSVY
jgi:hypothetical protein